MLRRVKIKSLPKAKDGGVSYNQLAPMYMPNNMGQKSTKVRNTLQPVPEEEATLEAEYGETTLTQVDGLPAHYNIGGKRHSQGGTPLNLPDESFIFSDTRSMIIRDPEVLEEFGETKPKTPAKIAKKYDINKYREILADPDMDDISKETAEKMISNYNVKLGKLAAYQESMKGEGIPVVSLPYLANNGLSAEDLIPLQLNQNPQEEMDEEEMYAEENPSEEELYDEETMPEAQFGLNFRRRRGDRLARRLERLRARQQFDPTTGIFLNTDNLGRVIYTDGNGIMMPQGITLPEGFMQPGMTINSRTKTSVKPTPKVTKSKVVTTKVDESKIKKKDDPTLKIGDYFKDDQGKLRKVVSVKYSNTPVRPSYSGKENYKPTYGSLEEDVKKANEILERLKGTDPKKDPSFAAGDGEKGWTIYAGAADKLSIREKDFLTRVASYNRGQNVKDIGAPGFKIARQSQYLDSKESKKKDNGFYGFADPEMLEFRYWQATNPNGTYDDFENLDDTKKIENRKGMLALHGYDLKELGDKVNDPSKLYTKDFVAKKGDRNSLSWRNEKVFKGKDDKNFRTEDDQEIGLDHLDAYTLGKTYGDVEVPDEYEEEIDNLEGEDLNIRNINRNTPFWLQDTIKTLGAAGDLARVKKYRPWSPTVNPYMGDPTFYDPTRELAMVSEQSQIATDTAEAYAPAQSLNARTSQIQGQAAKAAADVLGRYNNLNVGAANQWELTKMNVLNQFGLTNADIAKQLYDSTTIANQQYDNSKAQARQNLRQGYIDAITNRAMTQALNETYGQHYMVDPMSGGFVTFTGPTKELMPSNPYDDQKVAAFRRLKSEFPEADDEALLKLMGQNNQPNYANDYMKALASMYPTQTGAGYGQYYQEG